MTPVSVYEAKTHLSRLLRRVRHGEEIVISASGRPVARLVPIAAADGPRVLGGDEGLVWEAKDFNAPLPPELPTDASSPEPPVGADENDQHETTTAPSGMATDTGRTKRVFFIATSPS